MNAAILVGQDETQLCLPDEAAGLGAPLHRMAVPPFEALRAAAAERGFDVRILSGFRSFERQLSIWNRKARGELAVLDSSARPLDITTLSPRDLVFAILRWSALPGASRHHWGTDLDVYDEAARPEGYEVDLVPAEVESGGMFARLHEWLDERMAAATAFGFYRPYDIDRGGVAPERWHLSYSPGASEFLRYLSPDVLRATITSADMALKTIVLGHLEEIHARFVVNVAPAP